MIVSRIINHTPYTIGFTYGDKEIIIASTGMFNANHAYDKEKDSGVLRIVEDKTIITMARNLCIPNFIMLSDILSKEVRFNNIETVLSFFVKSGFGKCVKKMQEYKTREWYTPEKNNLSFQKETPKDESYIDFTNITIPEEYFINYIGDQHV